MSVLQLRLLQLRLLRRQRRQRLGAVPRGGRRSCRGQRQCGCSGSGCGHRRRCRSRGYGGRQRSKARWWRHAEPTQRAVAGRRAQRRQHWCGRGCRRGCGCWGGGCRARGSQPKCRHDGCTGSSSIAAVHRIGSAKTRRRDTACRRRRRRRGSSRRGRLCRTATTTTRRPRRQPGRRAACSGGCGRRCRCGRSSGSRCHGGDGQRDARRRHAPRAARVHQRQQVQPRGIAATAR